MAAMFTWVSVEGFEGLPVEVCEGATPCNYGMMMSFWEFFFVVWVCSVEFGGGAALLLRC